MVLSVFPPSFPKETWAFDSTKSLDSPMCVRVVLSAGTGSLAGFPKEGTTDNQWDLQMNDDLDLALG